MKNLFLFLFALCSAGIAQGQTLLVKTVAGTGAYGYSGDGGPATAAEVSHITGIANDGSGNVYLCDYTQSVIRKINASGNISTHAGTGTAAFTGNGNPATAADLLFPSRIAADNAGNIYILEDGTQVIRKIDASGNISIAAGSYMSTGYSGDGGPATAALLNYPTGIAVDAAGNLYIGDIHSRRIRKVDASGTITTFAGNGGSTYVEGAAATNTGISMGTTHMTCDNSGNFYFMDNNFLRKIDATGTITTIGGNGVYVPPGYYYWTEGVPATSISLQNTISLSAADDGTLYLCLDDLHRIVKIDAATNAVTTVAGDPYGSYGLTGENVAASRAYVMRALCLDASANDGFYYYDETHKVRKTYMGNFVLEINHPTTHNHYVCVNTGTIDMNNFFWTEDLDLSDTLTWSLISPPAHGTFNGSYSAPSNGAVLHPSSLSYTPDPGYTGTDLFAIRVSDGTAADTGYVNIIIQPTTITGTKTVCAGSSTTLSCTVPGGYWTSDNTSIANVDSYTGVVTGIAAGTTTISYVSPAGCIPTAIVTVNAAPDAIAGYPLVCKSQTTLLSNGTSGGTWQSSNISIAGVNATTGLVTGMNVGSANITYRLANGCRSTMEIYVDPQPDPLSGPNAICVEETAAYTHALGGYAWQSANTARATVDPYSGMVTGISAGTVNITLHINPGCYARKLVMVNALPTVIAGSDAVCMGTNITLTSTPAGGTWSSSDPASASVSGTGVVTGITAASGTYITYTRTNGCSRTKYVNVNTTPDDITGSTFVCKGSIGNLTSSPYDGTWTSAAPSTVGVVGWGTVSANLVGTARITYTLPTGCRKTVVVTVGVMPAAITGTTTICANSTVTLGATPAGHIWISDNTAVASVSSSGVVTGVTPGVTMISYATAQGCTRTAEIIVNDAVEPIAGTDVVCASRTTALACGTGGGTWASSATSKATVNTSTGVVTGVSAGTANISYIVSPGCRSIMQVTVNASPATITGTTSVCIGSTTTFSNSVPGGTWSSSNTALGSIDAAGIITGIAAGTPTISYILPNGCFKGKNITVNNLPTPITGTTTVCQGATTTLTTVGTSGGSWQSSNTSVATVSGGVVSGISGGTTTITRINGAGCIRTTDVTVNALPDAGAITSGTSYLVGDTATIVSSGAPGGSWASSNSGVVNINAASGFITATASGNATITYTVTNSCGSNNATAIFSVASMRPVAAGVQQASFALFPNPTSGQLTISTNVDGVLSVYSVDGKLVHTLTVTQGNTDFLLHQSLAAGTYVAQFSGSNGSAEIVRIVLNK